MRAKTNEQLLKIIREQECELIRLWAIEAHSEASVARKRVMFESVFWLAPDSRNGTSRDGIYGAARGVTSDRVSADQVAFALGVKGHRRQAYVFAGDHLAQ